MTAHRTGTEGEPDRPTDNAATEALSIAKDNAFHILQNRRRRAVLRYLLEHADRDQFRRAEIVEAVAAWEYNTSVQQLTTTQRQRVYIGCHQNHFPKLADHGLIKYHQDRGTIAPQPLIQLFTSYLYEDFHTDETDLSVSEDETATKSLSMAVSTLFSR